MNIDKLIMQSAVGVRENMQKIREREERRKREEEEKTLGTPENIKRVTSDSWAQSPITNKPATMPKLIRTPAQSVANTPSRLRDSTLPTVPVRDTQKPDLTRLASGTLRTRIRSLPEAITEIPKFSYTDTNDLKSQLAETKRKYTVETEKRKAENDIKSKNDKINRYTEPRDFRTQQLIEAMETEVYNSEQRDIAAQFESRVPTNFNVKPENIKLGGGNDLKIMVKYLTDDDYKTSSELNMLVRGEGSIPTSHAQYMTDKEKNTILYYASQNDYDSAQKYYNSLKRALNTRSVKSSSEKLADFTHDYPLIGTAMSPIVSAGGAIGGGLMLGERAINKLTGGNTPIDTNAPHMAGIHANTALKQGVVSAAEETGRKIGGDTGAWWAEKLASAGLSYIDNTTRRLIFGPLSLAVVGLDAFGSTAADVIERGGTESQAIKLGITNGIIEGLTEKLPFDEWAKVIGKGGAGSIKELATNVLRGAFSEFGEEAIGSIAGTIAENFVMKNKSQYNIHKQQLIDGGMDEKEADLRTGLEFFVKQAAVDGLTGAIAGGLGGGTASLFGIAQSTQARNQYYTDMGVMAKESGTGGVYVANGMKLDEYSRGYELANDINDRITNGQTVTEREMGQLVTYVQMDKYIHEVTNSVDNQLDVINRDYVEGGKPQALKTVRQAINEYNKEKNIIATTPQLTRQEKNEYIKKIDADIQRLRETSDDLRNNRYEAKPIKTIESPTVENVVDNVDIEDNTMNNTARPTNPDIENTPEPRPIIITSQEAKSTVDQLRKTLNKYGVKDIVIEEMSDRTKGYFNPDDNTIHLSSTLTDREAINRTVAHEALHFADQYDNTLANDIVNYMEESKLITPELRPEFTRQYREAYNLENKTPEEVERLVNGEMASEFLAMKVLENDNFLEQLNKNKPNLFQRIVDVIKRIYSRIKGEEYTGNIYNLPQTLRRIMVQNDVDIPTETGGVNTTDNGIRYQLVGKDDNGVEIYETSAETKNMPIKQREKALIDIISREYRGKTAKFEKDGDVYYALFHKDTARKNVYGDNRSSTSGHEAKINIGADGNFIDLVENAEHYRSSPEQGKTTVSKIHDIAKQWDYYVKTIRADGKYYDVVVNVADTGNNQYVYEVRVNEIADSPSNGNNDRINQRGTAIDGSIAQNGEVVNTSDENISESSNDDENLYQLSETENLIRDNARKAKRIKYLEDQMKFSKGHNVDRKQTAALAKQLIKDNGIIGTDDFNADVLTDKLLEVYDYIGTGESSGRVTSGRINALVDSELVDSKLREVAREIIERSWYEDDTFLQDHREVKSRLRDTKIFIRNEDRGDAFEQIGGFNEFRKRNFGRLRLVSDPSGAMSSDTMSVDSLYNELSEDYPSLFPESITHPSEQLVQMASVLDDFAPRRGNPYQGYESEATDELTGYLYDQFFDIPEEHTKADKIRQRDNAKHAKTYNALQVKLETLRQKHSEAMTKLKLDMNERFNRRLEKMDTTERVGTLNADSRKIMNRFKSMLSRPTDTRHIVSSLNDTVVAVNESVFSRQTGTRRDGMPMNAYEFREGRMREAYKRLKTAAENDPLLIIEPELLEAMGILGNIDGVSYDIQNESRRLSDFTVEKAQLLNQVMKGISRLNANYNRLLSDNRKITAQEAGRQVIKENATNRTQVSRHPLLSWAGNTWHGGMLNSWTMFEKLGDTMNEAFLNIVNAQDKHVGNLKTATDYMSKLLGNTDISSWSGRNAETRQFKLSNGKSVEMTAAQVMSLYLLDKQEDSSRHLLNTHGGMIRSDIRGKTKEIQPKRLTQADINSITSTLTAEQKKVADGVSNFFRDYTAMWGNEVSEQTLGYSKFTKENYFRIRVAREFRVNNIPQWGAEKQDPTLKNAGITKTRSELANNPIIVADIFDEFNDQVSTMAAYNAYVIPLDDFNKIMNYREYERGTESVEASIKQKYGERALKYINNFVNDVNSTDISRNQSRSDTGLTDTLIRNYKASAVGANLSVAAKQPMSIIRAASMISPQYLIRGTKHNKGDTDNMLSHSAIAQIKDWGYSDVGIGKNLRQVYDSNSLTKAEKLGNLSMSLAGKMDETTWTTIWNAAKLETADLFPDLQKNSDVFYDIANKRFREIIGRTQVVDSVFDTSDIMKDKNPFLRMTTAFMGEPLKTFNMLYSAVNTYNNDKSAANRKHLAAAIGTTALSSVVVGMVSSISGMLRDEEDEREIWLEKFIKETGKNAALDTVSMIPFVRDVVSLVQGYDIERLDMAALSELFNSLRKLYDHTQKDEPSTTPLSIVKDTVGAAGRLLGVPSKTIWRDIESAVRNFTQWTDNPYMEYGMKTMLRNVGASSNRAEFYDILNKAYLNNDYEAYNRIKTDMLRHGFTEEMIRNSLTKRLGEQFNELFELYSSDPAAYEKAVKSFTESGVLTAEDLEKDRVKRVNDQYKQLYDLSLTDKKAYDKMLNMLVDEGHNRGAVTKAVDKLRKNDLTDTFKNIRSLDNSTDQIGDKTAYNEAVKEAAERFGKSVKAFEEEYQKWARSNK